MVVTVLAWASAFIVIRGTGEFISGGALALGRLVVGAVLLAVIALVGGTWVRPTTREWLQVIGFGVLWFGGYNVALNIAEQTLDAGTTAMIVGIGPVLMALGAGIFLGEGIPKWLAIGAGVALLGVILIGIGSGGTRFGDGSGVVWGLVAAVAYTVGVLLQKPALRRLPAAQVTWLGCVIGMVACFPFALDLVREVQNAPVGAIIGVVYLGAVPTALAFSTWAYALSRMPAGQLGITTYLVPPLVIVLGLLVFGEVPAVLAVAGGAVCLVGVALARRRPRMTPTALVVTDPGKTVAE
ncbi:MAG: DMT family transporter [Salinibacterium sp.]|nr:DMT family transporter [Salinibacterium sp.]